MLKRYLSQDCYRKCGAFDWFTDIVNRLEQQL